MIGKSNTCAQEKPLNRSRPLRYLKSLLLMSKTFSGRGRNRPDNEEDDNEQELKRDQESRQS